jgi:pimeloyl-ACP methyl ester carboxylesterase
MTDDRPTLLLLHGLGATSGVWRGLTDLLVDRWPGHWLAPDLPGHGHAAPLPRYSFGQLAAAVAADLPADQPVIVLGHSLGGVVGLTLATGWFGVPVRAVCGLGIKVTWSADDLARAAAIAAKPTPSYPTREQAVDRYLKVAGLTGLVDPADPQVAAGVTEDVTGWRPRLDQAAFGVGAPDLPGLLAASRARVLLAAGEHDPMCSPDELAALPADHTTLPGLGHNAHVQDPAALLPLLDALLT